MNLLGSIAFQISALYSLAGPGPTSEQAVFWACFYTALGGLCFLVNGNMACGVNGDALIVRVGPEAYEGALAEPHTTVFDMTGRRLSVWTDEGEHVADHALQIMSMPNRLAGLPDARSRAAWAIRSSRGMPAVVITFNKRK